MSEASGAYAHTGGGRPPPPPWRRPHDESPDAEAFRAAARRAWQRSARIEDENRDL